MERDILEEQRRVEDRALELGEERREVLGRLEDNSKAMAELVRSAPDSVPLQRLARLLGVGRATIYRWLEGTDD